MIRPIGKLSIIFSLFTLLALGISSASYATFIVTSDRNQMTEADILRLQVKVENQTVNGQPDFTPLTQDFDVLGVSSPSESSSITIVNGRRSQTSSTTWQLDLRAKHLGVSVIPVLTFGGERSSPITISVVKQTERMRQQANQYVMLETSVNKNDAFVQGEIIYTVKLFYVDSVSGNFPAELNLEDAIVLTLEDEKRYDTVTNGRRYYVLEKKYAIYPQKSGELTIPRETFTGLRSGRGFFSQKERVASISGAHKINVRPKPKAFPNADWMPARSLIISETWNQETPIFKVGEPINRTIRIQVEGLAASLIPDLNDTNIPGAKTYQDPAVESQGVNDQGIVSRKEFTLGIVPTSVGEMTIPAINIPWWNTKTDSLEMATLPASSFSVLPRDKNDQASAAPTTIRPTDTLPIQNNTVPTLIQAKTSPLWQWIALVLLLLWLTTLGLWWASANRKTKQVTKASTNENTNANTLYKALIQACKQNAAAEAQRALFLWGKSNHPEINANYELAKVLGDESLLAEVKHLEAYLFAGDQAKNWNGEKLATSLAAFANTKTTKKINNDLAVSINP